MRRTAVVGLVMVGLAAAFVLSNVAQGEGQVKINQDVTPHFNKWLKDAVHKKEPTGMEPPPLTPAQKLVEGKKALEDKTISYGNLVDARDYLKGIPQEAKEFKEAQKLLKEVGRRQKKVTAIAENELQKKGYDSGEDAGIGLLAMQQKGLVELVLVEPSPLLYVEPLGWKNLKHSEKVKLGRLALDFVGSLNRQQGNKYLFVFIKDMTTKEKLGTVYLKENRVEINK